MEETKDVGTRTVIVRTRTAAVSLTATQADASGETQAGLVIGAPERGGRVFLTGTPAELIALLDKARALLAPPTTEIIVDRDPDAGTDLRVWRDGVEVTAGLRVVTIDPGAGGDRAEWGSTAEFDGLCEEARAHGIATKARYANSEYLYGDDPDEDDLDLDDA